MCLKIILKFLNEMEVVKSFYLMAGNIDNRNIERYENTPSQTYRSLLFIIMLTIQIPDLLEDKPFQHLYSGAIFVISI